MMDITAEIKKRALKLLSQIDKTASIERVDCPPDGEYVTIRIRKNNQLLVTHPITGTELLQSPSDEEKDDLVRARLRSALLS